MATTVVKMRVTRISHYDSGTQNMSEVQLVSTDRDGKQLNPTEEIAYANFSGTFVSPNGDNFQHDGLVDVSFAAGVAVVPEAASAAPTKKENE